jgi:hypothetical protein
VIEIFSKLADFSPPVFAALFFYIYSNTGEGLFLVITGITIIAWVAWLLFKTPLALVKAKSDTRVADTIESLSPSKHFDARAAQEKYKNAYAEALHVMHSLFDVKGLTTQGVFSLELEQVFVQLNIAPRQVDHNNPLDVPIELRHGNHEIWDFINSPILRHLAVIGVPGSGKTTLLRYVALAMAYRGYQTDKLIIDKLPILLFIRDHAQEIANNPNIKLIDLISKDLDWMQESVPTTWFEKHLEAGQCLVMLDGLDEVGNLRLRRKVANWVERQTRTYYNNRFIVSSRPNGYTSNPIAGMTLLHVQTFNAQQVEKFVENWYVATEMMSQQRPKGDKRVRFEAKKGAADLLKRIRSNLDLAELAINPLLLTMIANVHRWRSALPGRRVELYAEMCEVFLGKRRQAAGIEDILTPAQKQSVLQGLAYVMMQRNKREISLADAAEIIAASLELLPQKMTAKDFIHLIRDGSGILIEREMETYAFSHKTFQEFMAATHAEREKYLPQLLKLLDQAWWHETIRLYCARNDATPIVSACLAKSPPPLETLVLAIQCADEALQLDGAIRQTLNALIEKGLDSDNDERFNVTARAKLALRLKELSRLDDDRYADSSLITNAEFQLFLGEYSGYAPNHWQDDHFPKGEARQAVVGVSPATAEAFCEWLTKKEVGVGWAYRLPKKDDVEAGEYWAISKEGYTVVRRQARKSRLLEWVQIDYSNFRAALAKELLEETITVSYQHFSLQEVFQCISFQLSKDRDLASNSDLPLSHTLQFTRDFAKPRNRALEFSRDLTGVRNGALNLARAIVRDRSNIRAFALFSFEGNARTRAKDLAYDLAQALISARDFADTLTSDSDYVSKLTSDRARILADALTGNRAHDFATALASDSDFAFDLAHTRDLVSVFSNAHTIAYELNNAFTAAFQDDSHYNRARAYSRAHTLTITLESACKHISQNGLWRQPILLMQEVAFCLLVFSQWFKRNKAVSPSLGPYRHYDLGPFRLSLLEQIQQHYSQQFNIHNQALTKIWRYKLDQQLQMYAQFVALEMRRRGEWSAFEGIRIVREKVQGR